MTGLTPALKILRLRTAASPVFPRGFRRDFALPNTHNPRSGQDSTSAYIFVSKRNYYLLIPFLTPHFQMRLLRGIHLPYVKSQKIRISNILKYSINANLTIKNVLIRLYSVINIRTYITICKYMDIFVNMIKNKILSLYFPHTLSVHFYFLSGIQRCLLQFFHKLTNEKN